MYVYVLVHTYVVCAVCALCCGSYIPLCTKIVTPPLFYILLSANTIHKGIVIAVRTVCTPIHMLILPEGLASYTHTFYTYLCTMRHTYAYVRMYMCAYSVLWVVLSFL